MDKRRSIAVVGGANVDIGGFPSARLLAGDSNPGKVRISSGGVGRNIAENAARMGLNVNLVSAIGSDANGRMLLEDCAAKSIGTGQCLIEDELSTSVYLFMVDESGDMHSAINDMEIQSRLTPEALAERLDFLNAMSAVVIDANLPPESILYLCENLQVPVFADAVSAAKAGKLRAAMPYIHCIKPNRLEAELLTGMQIRDFVDAAECARRMVEMGAKQVFLTLGDQGALCADARQCIFLPCKVRGIVNATGAGDAFTAALVWAHCEGMDLRKSGIAGMAASEIAITALETVSPKLSRASLIRKMADVEARL